MSAAAAAQLTEEDAARASFYALIGRLFFDAPDAELLSQIARDAAQADASATFGAAWVALGAACRDAHVDSLREEHLALFGGVGRALVTPYTSAYVTHTLHERHLLALRQHLAALGLSRQASANDPEDHVAGLCDVMRHLITRYDSEHVQKEFFSQYLYVGVNTLCGKVLAAERAHFYKSVAQFALAFLEVEHEGFEMLE